MLALRTARRQPMARVLPPSCPPLGYRARLLRYSQSVARGPL